MNIEIPLGNTFFRNVTRYLGNNPSFNTLAVTACLANYQTAFIKWRCIFNWLRQLLQKDHLAWGFCCSKLTYQEGCSKCQLCGHSEC